ncbi:sensor histidine kinase [Sphingomonas lycopersici]|uniref:histidine kinase n=1 Tax=Sphingomonas lycopersici TaxID=2951807 RepID=A0AA42CUY4_9SPHN|nr:HAMP domain-containing sensor histidine kinase [Sphingomonas lycopersici]MCW6535938.1 HAMP domain-containing histidine kinase [Sphingomonas lycopersici]
MPARLRRSTFGLVAAATILLALATVAIGAIAYEITHEALEKQLDHRIAAETHSLIAESGGRLPGIAAAIRRRSAAQSTSSLDYILVARDGGTIIATIAATLPDRPGFEEFLHYHRDNRTGVAQALTTRLPDGTLVVAADRSDLAEIDHILAMLFASALAAMLVAGIAAAATIGWVTRRRLGRIDAAAQAIIAGDLARRVPQDGSNSEFDRLATTLNRMLDRIGGLIENLRQVSSDVAHDLRTPLTRLHHRLETAIAETDPGRQVDAIEAARTEAAELLGIFAALLRIAELEGSAECLPREPVGISALIEQMGETYAPDFEAADMHFTWSSDHDLEVHGDRRLLSQALANLLDNALNHTPAGTSILLEAKARNSVVEIAVSDDGPGIALADPAGLFRRFARGERARATPGHGLGLSLVAAVAAAMGGGATISTRNGFVVTLSLPIR